MQPENNFLSAASSLQELLVLHHVKNFARRIAYSRNIRLAFWIQKKMKLLSSPQPPLLITVFSCEPKFYTTLFQLTRFVTVCIKTRPCINYARVFVLGIQISMQDSVRSEDFPAVFMKIQVF